MIRKTEDVAKYIMMFLILTGVGYFYDKYKKKYDGDDELSKYHLVKKFLLNEDPGLGNISGKPTLWIHSEYELNSKRWRNFGSRTSKNLNKKYVEMCVESVVKYCGDSFNVCLINDDSFSKLIPGWQVDMDLVSDPIKKHIRILALMKILYYYGGMCLPNSTLIMRDIRPLYDELLRVRCMFAGEMVSRNSTSTMTRFYTSNKMMGCKKKSNLMEGLIKRVELLLSNDNTEQMDFEGEVDRILYKMHDENTISLIEGKAFGNKTKDDKVVLVDDLLGNSYINFDRNMFGIYLPKKEIEKRTKFQWFGRLNRQQILNANTIVTKYFLISAGQ
tara:strand:- start:8124 stop:9116 length:993 start_codon:yes stop_codon:yes gene_type:complete